MSFKTFFYSVFTILFVLICGAISKLLVAKYKEIFNLRALRSSSRRGDDTKSKHEGTHIYRDEPQSVDRYPSEAGRGEKAHRGEIELVKSGSRRKSRGSPSIEKGPERLPCRRKLEAALPIILQAVELDNAGSLEAVGAYKQVVKLFDDAIKILNNRPQEPTQARVEADLRHLRDTYRDRADLLLLDFQERVLNRKL